MALHRDCGRFDQCVDEYGMAVVKRECPYCWEYGRWEESEEDDE